MSVHTLFGLVEWRPDILLSMHRIALMEKNYLVPNVNSSEAEKSLVEICGLSLLTLVHGDSLL